MEARVVSVCTSGERGVQKRPVASAVAVAGFGLEDDAHAGGWHRQVSLLAVESVRRMRTLGADVGPGDFAENLLVDGLDPAALEVGVRLEVGPVLLEVTQIGKECHTRCAIYRAAGTCVMPSEGVFCRVLRGGPVVPGAPVAILDP